MYNNNRKSLIWKQFYTTKSSGGGGRDGVARTEDSQLELKLARPRAMGSGRRYQSRGTIRSGLCRVLDRRVESGCSTKPNKIAELAHRGEVGLGKVGAQVMVSMPLWTCILEGMEQSLAQQLVDQAHQVCPYSNDARRIDVRITAHIIDAAIMP